MKKLSQAGSKEIRNLTNEELVSWHKERGIVIPGKTWTLLSGDGK